MRTWLAKPENQSHFQDDENAKPARHWQNEHSGYWKNTAPYKRFTLQDGCREQAIADQQVAPNAPDCTLQDLCSMQPPLLVGLVSMFVGSTLHDDIAASAQRQVSKGHDILGLLTKVATSPAVTARAVPCDKIGASCRSTAA
jgi:hypothetical protein